MRFLAPCPAVLLLAALCLCGTAAAAEGPVRLEPPPGLVAQPSVQAVDPELERAHGSFKDFASKWLVKVSANYRFRAGKEELEQRDGRWVARILRLDPTTLETEVKPSSSKASPYVGVLKYIEQVYESEGPTPEDAKRGPYSAVKKRRVTGIFRYANNHWIY